MYIYKYHDIPLNMLLNSYVEAEVNAKENVLQLRHEIVELSDTVWRLQWEITEKTNSSSELDKAIIAKNAIRSRLETDINTFTESLSQIKKERLTEIQQADSDLSALREDSSKLIKEIESMNQLKERTNKAVKEMEATINKLTPRLQALQILISEQEAKREDLSDREKKLIQKQKELEAYEARLHARYVDIQSIKAKLDKRETWVLVKEDNAKKIIERAVKNK